MIGRAFTTGEVTTWLYLFKDFVFPWVESCLIGVASVGRELVTRAEPVV